MAKYESEHSFQHWNRNNEQTAKKITVAFDMGETTVDDKKLGFYSLPIASSYWIF
jgi:signal recognition particle receptor subunit beta